MAKLNIDQALQALKETLTQKALTAANTEWNTAFGKFNQETRQVPPVAPQGRRFRFATNDRIRAMDAKTDASVDNVDIISADAAALFDVVREEFVTRRATELLELDLEKMLAAVGATQ